MRYYNSVEEVRRRLANGVVFYKGEPVTVIDGCSIKSKESKYGVILADYPNHERKWKVPLNDEDLNYRDFRVGFLNAGSDVYRVIRWPHRGVQQSLTTNNCTLEKLGDKHRVIDREEGGYLSLHRLLRRNDAGTLDSAAGRFPSRTQARLDVIEGRAKSRAFGYDWAYQMVMGVPALWYKSKPVCLTMEENSILRLEDKNGYMKESLNELGLR